MSTQAARRALRTGVPYPLAVVHPAHVRASAVQQIERHRQMLRRPPAFHCDDPLRDCLWPNPIHVDRLVTDHYAGANSVQSHYEPTFPISDCGCPKNPPSFTTVMVEASTNAVNYPIGLPKPSLGAVN